MSNVINLNQARKRRAGAQKKRAADANAAKMRGDGAEGRAARSEDARRERRLDDHRLDREGGATDETDPNAD